MASAKQITPGRPPSMLGGLEVEERRYKEMTTIELHGFILDVHLERHDLAKDLEADPVKVLEMHQDAIAEARGGDGEALEAMSKDQKSLAKAQKTWIDSMREMGIRMSRAMPSQG